MGTSCINTEKKLAKMIFLIISKRYKKIGYNIDVLRQTACLVVNPIKVNSFAYLFNCTTVDVLRQTACLVVNPIKVNSFAYLFNCTTVGRASD